MEKQSCEYAHMCKECTVTYKKQCAVYCRRYAGFLVLTINPGNLSEKDLQQARPLRKRSVHVTTSKTKAAAALLQEIQKDMRRVKIYKMSTAIDAAVSGELPQESLVYIEACTKYKENEKGLQVLESFTDQLAEAGKTVVMHIPSGFQKSDTMIVL